MTEEKANERHDAPEAKSEAQAPSQGKEGRQSATGNPLNKITALQGDSANIKGEGDFSREEEKEDHRHPENPPGSASKIILNMNQASEEEKVEIQMLPVGPKEEQKVIGWIGVPQDSPEEKKGTTEADSHSVKKEAGEDAIIIENVHKTYLLGLEGVAALRGVSLTIKKKEFICIFGTSGGGKTTLLNLMGTIDKPTKGNVHIGGLRVRNSTADKDLASLRLNKLSFVFQTFNLISSLTALENVELPMQLKGDLARDKIRERAIELLTQVGLGERVSHFPRQLSGGEQQRVTIARALANKPEIMLLDEPTGDLDTKSTDVVMKILLDLNRSGITMVMVTHDLNLKNYAHRVIRITDGKVPGEELIDPSIRERYVQDLFDRVNNPSKEKLTIREGADYSQTKDMKIYEQEIIDRFPTKLSATTSVRAAGDYRILRFAMADRAPGRGGLDLAQLLE